MESAEEKDNAETLRERREESAPNSKNGCGANTICSKAAPRNKGRQPRMYWYGFGTNPISPFAEFVASEIAEAVVGGVFVEFAERRIVENLLDKFVDSEAVVEDHHADVDELGGILADDADAEKFFISAGEDELEHACCVSGDVGARVVGVKCA